MQGIFLTLRARIERTSSSAHELRLFLEFLFICVHPQLLSLLRPSLTRPADARDFSYAPCSNRTHFFVGARIASVSGVSVHLRSPSVAQPFAPISNEAGRCKGFFLRSVLESNALLRRRTNCVCFWSFCSSAFTLSCSAFCAHL